MSDKAVSDAGIFDVTRMRQYLQEYHADTDSVSLVRKDALLNHIIGLQILHRQFIQNNEAPASMESIRPLVEQVI